MFESMAQKMHRLGFEFQKVSLEKFLILLQDFRKDVSSAHESLIATYTEIDMGEDVESYEYSKMIDSIKRLKDLVETFYRFLVKPSHLPHIVGPLRYQLLIALHHTDELAGILMSLIITFHANHKSLSPQVITLRQKTIRKLVHLMQSDEDILQSIDILNFQILSRTKCLVAV